jgi:hypothetical protein
VWKGLYQQTSDNTYYVNYHGTIIIVSGFFGEKTVIYPPFLSTVFDRLLQLLVAFFQDRIPRPIAIWIKAGVIKTVSK